MMERIVSLAVFTTVVMIVSVTFAADLDRSALDFQTPAEIDWVRNAAGASESRCYSANLANRNLMSCATDGYRGT